MLSGKSGAEIITLVERSQDLSSAAKAEVLEVPLRIQMSKKAEESFSLREWLMKISQDLVFAPGANDKTPLLEAFETKEEIVSAMSGIIFSVSGQRIKKALEENQLISEIAEFMSSPKSQTIALVPGAFKPPHRGHLDMVKHYSKLSDVVVILISPLSRGSGTGEVTVSDSKKVWDIYLNAEGLTDVRVEVSEYNSPIRAAIEYGNKPEVAGSHIILGTSTIFFFIGVSFVTFSTGAAFTASSTGTAFATSSTGSAFTVSFTVAAFGVSNPALRILLFLAMIFKSPLN